MAHDIVDDLYDNLKEDGWIENGREDFRAFFFAPGEQGYKNRKALYDNLKDDGYVDSPTYEVFARRLGLQAAAPKQTDKPAPTQRTQQLASTTKPKEPEEPAYTFGDRTLNAGDVPDFNDWKPKHADIEVPLKPQKPEKPEDNDTEGMPQYATPEEALAAFKEQSQKIVGDTQRMFDANKPENRAKIQALKMAGQIQGRKTDLPGLTVMPSQGEGGIGLGTQRKSLEGPKYYGTTTDAEGKSVDQWLMPDGSVTTDFFEADAAEAVARQSRLQREFTRRMEHNGLDVSKPEDVEVQKAYDRLEEINKEYALEEDERLKRLNEYLQSPSQQLAARGNSMISGLMMPIANPETQISEDEISRHAEKRALEQAIMRYNAGKLKKTGSFFATQNIVNAAHGVKDVVTDIDTYAAGMESLTSARVILGIKAKLDKGEQLTRREQSLMESMLVQQTINEQTDVPHGYTMGYTIANMVQFMAQMYLNPTSAAGTKAGQLAVKTFAKTMAKQAGQRAAKNFVVKAATKLGKKRAAAIAKAIGVTAGDITSSMVLANTFQAPSTMADASLRHVGEVAFDKDGNLHFVNGEGVITAFAKAEAAAGIENYTEMLGAHFGLIGTTLGRGASKVARKLGGGKMLDQATRLITNIKASDFAKGVAAIESRAEWHGSFGEMLEEEAGIVLNSIITGDNKLSDLVDKEQQIDIALGVGVFGAFVSGIKTVGYPIGRYKARHRLEGETAECATLFGDEWASLQATIDNADEKDLSHVLCQLTATGQSMTIKKANALIKYASALTRARSYNIAAASVAAEAGAPDQQQVEQSYDNGYNAEGAEMADAKNLFDATRQKAEETLDAEIIEQIDSNPVAALMEMRRNGLYSEDEIASALDYANAKAAYDGMQQRINDDIDTEIAQSDAMISARTNKTSAMIHPAIAGLDNRKVYIVGGLVVTNAEGTIDRDASDESLIIRDAATGELTFVDPKEINSVEEAIDPEVERAEAIDAIRQKGLEAATNTMKGTLAFNPGDVVTIENGAQATIVQPDDPKIINKTITSSPALVDENGRPREDVVFVQLADGTLMGYTKEQLQAFADAAMRERLDSYEAEKAAAIANQKGVGAGIQKPQFALNDEFTILNDAGEPVRGSITGELDEDGTVEIYTEEPINGNRVNRFTPAELEEMFDTYNGEPVATTVAVPEAEAPQQPIADTKEYDRGFEEGIEVSTSLSDEVLNQAINDLRGRDFLTDEWRGRLEAYEYEQQRRQMEAQNAPAEAAGNNDTENIPQNGNIAPENIPQTENPAPNAQPEQPQSALSRIPLDEKGKPNFEAADVETAWDAIVEKTSNEKIAQSFADNMVANAEAALKKAEKTKTKSSTDIDEFMEAENERLAAIERAKVTLEHWKAIAGTAERRRAERRAAEDAEARRRAQERAEKEARLKAEREEAERIEREALNGVPDWNIDTPADARARGYRRNGPQKVDRPEIIDNHTLGNSVEVKFGDDVMPKGNIAVIEASQLQPSHRDGQRNPAHFLDEAQPKERKDAVSRFAAAKIAETMRPEEITSSVTAFTGAPSVNSRGEVIQGNNRSEALRIMYERYPQSADKYKQYLIDHAAEFGLTPEAIAAFEQPVLVNMLDVSDEDAITLGQYVAQDTESGGIERIKPKNAVQKMGDKIRTFANLLLRSADDEATFAQLVDDNGLEVLKWMNQQGYITNTQYASAFDSKGNLTAEAANDLKGIMYQSIFTGGSTRLEEMFNKMPAKAQRAILATAFRDHDSAFADRMISEIQQSIIAFNALMNFKQFRDASNAKDTQNAVEAWEKQFAFDDVSGEPYLPSETFSNFALALAAMYKGHTQRHIQSVFNMMYDIVQGTEQDNLFEAADKTPKPLAEAIRRVLNLEYQPITKPTTNNGTNGSAVLDVNSEDGQDGRPGSDGNADGAEQSQEEAEPSDGGTGTASDSGQGGEVATEEEIEAIIASMKAMAKVIPIIEITDKNWRNNITTPLGVVKMGENQKEKLFAKGREQQYGMLLETLGKPDIILEEADQQDNIFHERPSSYLFIKTFQREDGSKYVHFESVTVSQEGMEVSISSHIIRENQLRNKMKSDRLLYKATALDEPANSPAEQPINQGGSLSSDGKDNTLPSVQQEVGSKSSLGERVKAAEAEHTEPTGDYTIDTYTTKKGKTYHRVVFPRADKAVWQERLNLAKKMGGTSVPKGYGFKTREEAEAFAKAVANPETVADAQPLSLEDMRPTTGIAQVDVDGLMTQLSQTGEANLADFSTPVNTEEAKPTSDKPVNPSGNKLVTDERYAELRERMRKKLGGQLNMGVDPEILAIGTEMAVYHIEKGARKFKAYASAMIADLGDVIRPYLKSFYNAVRDMPEAEAAGLVSDMDSYDEVRSVDIANFDKPGTDAMATAAAVVAEQQAETEKAEAERKLQAYRHLVNKYAQNIAESPMFKKAVSLMDSENVHVVGSDLSNYYVGEDIVSIASDKVNKMFVDQWNINNGTLQSAIIAEAIRKANKAIRDEQTTVNSDGTTTQNVVEDGTEIEITSGDFIPGVRPTVDAQKPGGKKKPSVEPEQTMGNLFGNLFDIEDNSVSSQKDNTTSKPKTNEKIDLQPRTEGTGRGGQQPRPNEPLGEGAKHENERTDGGGVAKRSGVHTVSDSQRSGSVSQPHKGERSLTEPKNTHNNHAERGVDYAPKGEKARIDANIAALELAKKLLASGATATPQEMAILRRYSGWGGLGAAFNEGSAWAPNPVNKRLREALTPEEYQAAVMSRNSAYYTPAAVIDAMWDVAKALGFKGGNIVEGSAGIGNIIGLMPTEISERSNIHAVEIDPTTGGILSLLYPDAKVEVQGFEQTRIANGSVDLAITNVPFVTDLHVMDESGDSDLSKKFRDIHDFCIAKNVRKLREGGIGIFITSSGTLDKSQKLRNWLVGDKEGNADVVGVFRMNNQTFGGTAATSDIIVVRKRVNGRKSANAIDVSTVTPARTATFTDARGKTKDLPLYVNRYFIEHPEHMGGEMFFGFEQGDTYRPTSIGLFPTRTADQAARMAAWVQHLADMDWSKEQGKAVAEQTSHINEALGEGVKEGSMVTDSDGNLCVARMGRAVPLALNKNKIKGRTKEECFKDYTEIKSALADVLKYQTEHDDDAGLQPLLDRLNRAYDTFVQRYGNLNKNNNLAWLRNDVDFSSIVALETYSEKGNKDGTKIKTYGKTDIFSRRVVEKESKPTPKNVKDGIIASIYKYGRIDTDYLVTQLGKSQDDVKQEIVESGLGFVDPTTGQMEVSYEYLSGNVREKLRQAREANEAAGGAYDANIKALEAVVPMNIPAHLIEFTLGSSWIEPQLYERYVKERTELNVKLTNAGGTWHMAEPWNTDKPKNTEMGVRSEAFGILIPGHKLIEAALTNKTITVSRTVKDSDGGSHTETDPAATTACATKVDEIRQDFKDWAREQMQNDPALSMRMEEKYNEKFNNSVTKTIPDDFVPSHFGGAATVVNGDPFQLRPHQAKAVIRATTQPVLLAHEVGTGKTYTLITTAMEMRRLGTARKPMIVVQNATVGQFVASAKALYPNAKILTLEDADRNEEGRMAFYAKIKYNDWDMIVVPQSVFERIPDSIERQTQFIQDKIEEKMLVLEQMKEADPDGRSTIVRAAEREISRLEDEMSQLASGEPQPTSGKKKKDAKKEAITRQNAEVKARELLDRATDDVEDFDSMGIDALLVDEAHEYKHLGFATAMQRGVKGVDPSPSKKSQGVFLKVQSVLEKTGGKNVVFATGTPISNTAAEIWTFMRYLIPADVMKEYDIFYFDDFVRNFGNIQQMLEFKTNGKYDEVNRFAGYFNLPELVRIWSTVADTVLTREAGGVSDKIPQMEGGKAQDIFLPQTRALRSIMKFVKDELKRYEDMTGKEKKENSHIPLVMYGIAKAAAVDARLVQSDAEDDPKSKTNEAVRQTLRSLEETKDYKGTVAIFADNYQNKASGFNLYEDIRKKLIAAGVPEEQVVVMKSGMTVKKKLEIFDKVNSGEVRVIMGSTFTLGTGVNIQERLHTLIHLDAPNRPMDYTQRNGRILRQGNLHNTWGLPVRILRFGVEDSLDVTAYQRLKTKGAIADSIMNGKQLMANSMENRTLEEDQDLFGDITAQLSGSEYAMLKNQIEKEVRKLRAAEKNWKADQTYIHNRKRQIAGQNREAEKRIADNKSYLEKVEAATIGDITVGRLSFPSVEGMEDFFTEQNKKKAAMQEEVRTSGYSSRPATSDITISVGGFDFKIHTEITKEMKHQQGDLFATAPAKMTYSCPELGIDAMPVRGNAIKNAVLDIMENVVSGKDFRERIAHAENYLERNNAEFEAISKRDGQPFKDAEALEKAEEKLAEYEELMKKEMEEKEAKYADMDKEVEAAANIEYTEEDSETEEAGEPTPAYNPEKSSKFANSYETQEGKTVRYNSANPEAYAVSEPEDGAADSGAGRAGVQRKKDTPITTSNIGGLNAAEGEFSLVERQFTENKSFSFTSGARIKSADDVAFIFSALEDAAKEHSFVVYVKNGKPTVIELGMGTFSATMVDVPTASLAYSRIKPDQVYFVHNHPSGQLKCSTQDIQVLRAVESMCDVPVLGVIINLKTGRYGTFDTSNNTDVGVKRTPAKEHQLKVYTLDKQIFAPDYDPMSQPLVKGSYDVASFLNSQRMGDRAKVSFLILTRANRIVGNIHTPFTEISSNPREVARYISERVIQLGGESAILYGDFEMTAGASTAWQRVKTEMDNVGKTRLLDVVSVMGNHSRSANDEDLLREPGSGYGAYSDAEVSFANDPVSKVMGKNRFSKKRQAEFAARERQRMVARIQELAERMHLDNVEILTDATQLEGKRAKAKGFYNKRTGKITIVIPNNVSTIDAEQTLLHEAVAHFGLRQLFGEQFNTFLNNVYESADESIRRKIAEMAAKNGWDFRTATEEYLAGLAETFDFENALQNAGWWATIKRLFLDMLESIGFEGFRDKTGVVLTDNELRYLLWRSYENLTEPGASRSILGEAADVAKQAELKVGNYAERGIEAEYAAEPYSSTKIEEVNNRFNAELRQQINQTLPAGHIYQLGRPGKILRSTGIPDLPIQMSASRLKSKATEYGHDFDISEIKNLVKELQEPIAVFAYGNKGKMQNIVVGIESNGKQFIVGLSLNPVVNGKALEINSIRNVFPKDNAEWLNWITQGKMLYADKEKIQALIDKQRTILADVDYLNLDDVTKIVKSFENPTIEEEELFRPGDFTPRDKAFARREYERMVSSGSYQFQEAVQDSMLGLKKLYQTILGKGTRIENVSGFENAYLFENRMSSMNAGEQHEYFIRYMQPLLKEIGRIAGANKRKRRELTDYLMAKHGLERNEYMRNEAAANGEETDRDFAGLIGLTGEADWQSAEDTARQWVDDYEAMYDTAALWEAINKATKATLEKIYLSGIISKETYEKILGMYQFYIPLRGWNETTSEQVYGYLTSKDGPLGGSIMKKAEGRESMADDPIATIDMMADDAIRQGNRNLMKQRFLNFILNHPSDAVSVHDLWLEYNDVNDEWVPVFADVEDTDTADEVAQKVEAFEQRMEALCTAEPDKYKKGREAQHIPYKVVKGNLREHQILIKRNGRTFVATINGNPRAAQALNGLTNPDVDQNGVVGNMLKAGTWINRQLSAFYTTRNPDFVVSNFFRDALYSNCMTWVKESPRYALRFHKNFGRVNPVVMRRLLGKWESGTLDMNNRLESLFYQFMINGGETGYTNVRDIEGHKRAVAAELKKQGSVGRKAWAALGMQLDLLNRSAENCARFAAFITSRDFGRSIDRAIYDAKEISVNFNKKGSGGKMVNANGQTKLGKFGAYLSGTGRLLYVFWNTGVQAMTNFGRQAKLHPIKSTAGASAPLTLGYIIPMLAEMLGGGDGDDDDKNAYYNLPEYIRRSNICFRAGEQWITIPLPIEYRAMYGMGELAHGVISGNERYTDAELGRQMAAQISQIMPLDMLEGGGGISPFIPSAAKPFTEAYIINKSWTGLPVYKDTPFNKNDPEWTKAYASADKHLVAFAKWLNETSGGDDFKKGSIDINPAKIEYLLNGTFGGLFTFPNKVKKTGETVFGDRDFEWRNTPIANRLIKSGDERTANRKLQNEYFNYKAEYEETGRLIRKYENADERGVMGYAEKVNFMQNSDEYLRWEIFDEFKPDIDSYRERIATESNRNEREKIEAQMYLRMRELVNALHDPKEHFKELYDAGMLDDEYATWLREHHGINLKESKR